MNRKLTAWLMPVCLVMPLTISSIAIAHQTQNASTTMPSNAAKSPGSMQFHKIMTDSKRMPVKVSGNVDKDFATMMTMHHQTAIKMSDAMLQYGNSPELKALAAKMKAAQQEEITQMAPYTQ